MIENEIRETTNKEETMSKIKWLPLSKRGWIISEDRRYGLLHLGTGVVPFAGRATGGFGMADGLDSTETTVAEAKKRCEIHANRSEVR